MQTMTKTNRTFWITPAVGVAGGLVYLIAFSLGGHPGYGLAGLGVMVVFSAAIALIGAIGGVAYLGAVGYFRVRG